MKPTNLNFTSGVLLISVPDVFFLVEEQSEAWQESQPVRACELGAEGPVQANRISIFLGGKVNVGGCHEFLGHNLTNFWSS